MSKKILVIRLSSIGDILLTTPILEKLREIDPTAQLHYLTKPAYKELLAYHPGLTALHLWPPSNPLLTTRWDVVLDLQKNLRTAWLRQRLRYATWQTFPKENWRKWLYVRLKRVQPIAHVVKRYGEVLRLWGAQSAELGPLRFYIPPTIQEAIQGELLAKHPGPWVAVGLGGTYETKKWPPLYHAYLLEKLGWPAILLGGVLERSAAETIAQRLSVPVVIGAGRYSLLESGAAIAAAQLVISHDTGTAHMAAAFRKPIALLWGNTTPAFGMGPWQTPTLHLEVPGLPCRPCSKLGYRKCPKGHHNCMHALTPDWVWQSLQAFLKEAAA